MLASLVKDAFGEFYRMRRISCRGAALLSRVYIRSGSSAEIAIEDRVPVAIKIATAAAKKGLAKTSSEQATVCFQKPRAKLSDDNKRDRLAVES
jgi:hypothetical protein